MKKIIPLLLFLFLQLVLINHGNAQQVITTAGDYFEGDNLSLSWTVGEPVIETFASGNLILMQGLLSMSQQLLFPDTQNHCLI
jgi:hypothetical protein